MENINYMLPVSEQTCKILKCFDKMKEDCMDRDTKERTRIPFFFVCKNVIDLLDDINKKEKV